MSRYEFSPDFRRVLERVRQEAENRGHDRIGLEHFALVLLSPPWAEATAVVFCVDADAARVVLEDRLGPGAGQTQPDLPYSAGANRLLESAMSVARERRESSITVSELRWGFTRFAEGAGLVASLVAERVAGERSGGDFT